jgi:hypothetical protein
LINGGVVALDADVKSVRRSFIVTYGTKDATGDLSLTRPV